MNEDNYRICLMVWKKQKHFALSQTQDLILTSNNLQGSVCFFLLYQLHWKIPLHMKPGGGSNDANLGNVAL